MTETNIVSSANESKSSAQDQVASGNEDQTKKDQVAYDTYRRTLGEAKKYKSESAELKAKLEQYENAKLESEGKKDEVIEKLRKEKNDLYVDLKNTKASYAETQIRSQVELKATALGCVDTDALVKLMDLEGLDIVDGYKVSEQSLDMVLQKAKKEKSYLFGNIKPNIQDGIPNNVTQEPTTKGASDLSIGELKKRAKEIDAQEGKIFGVI